MEKKLNIVGIEKNFKMEKVERDGKIAVLISPGYGSGWSTWNSHEELLFHPKIVEMVENDRRDEIDEQWIEEELGLKDVYCGGVSTLIVEWLKKGTQFIVEDYDGSESITTIDSLYLIA